MLIPIILLIISPKSFSLVESTPPKLEVLNDDSTDKPFFELQQAFIPERTILPKTNLTVSNYINIALQDTFNTTVSSLNRTHWFVHCDYSISYDEPSFDSIVSRMSINHLYMAENYWDWDAYNPNPSFKFDFWIDTTGFYDGYQFELFSEIATVSTDKIKMNAINQEFNAWKISLIFEDIFPASLWFAVDNGLFLCLKQQFGEQFIWYNLTKAEIAQPPQDYCGPYLIQVSHNNNSRLASNTLISLELSSPYGTDITYYHWDDNINSTSSSSFISINLPAENDSHDLIIITFDNVGYWSVYHLIYTTDNTLPGISLINLRNNSKIKASTPIQLQISSGNGTIFYRWDGGNNETVDEGTNILIPNPELETSYTLEVYVKGITGLWVKSIFILNVDNSPPSLTYSIENNSVIKGDAKILVYSTEDINLTFRLMDLENQSVLIETGQNHTITYSNLVNGSYQLFIIATDEAHNIASTTLIFSVYTSAFNWNWGLEARTPRTIKIINASSDLWFILTLTSTIDQSFNLTVLPEDSYPTSIDMIKYVIEFRCEEPDEIIFMSLTLQLSSNASVFPVYQWVHWDGLSEEWVNITTSYNEVSNSWEAIYSGFVQYFALINPGIETTLISIIPGGGQIPSFEIIPALLSLMTITILVYNKKKPKKNSKHLGLT